MAVLVIVHLLVLWRVKAADAVGVSGQVLEAYVAATWAFVKEHGSPFSRLVDGLLTARCVPLTHLNVQ